MAIIVSPGIMEDREQLDHERIGSRLHCQTTTILKHAGPVRDAVNAIKG